MNARIYEKGTIKVVWIESNVSKIYSKMFNNEKSAEGFAHNKEDYIIFSLINQKNMKEFSWKLLPYGKYLLYKSMVGFYKKHKGSILNMLTGMI